VGERRVALTRGSRAGSSCAREPSPALTVVPAPPPVFKVSFKEWQARRKLERAKEVEVAQECEKERQRGLEREQEREWEREKDAATARTRRTRSSPRRLRKASLASAAVSAVGDKPPVMELPVPQDVEMANAVPLAVAPAVASIVPLDELQPKVKVTGNEHLSPLAVPSVVESRAPSPRLASGIRREASSLAVNDVASPAVLAPKSPPSDVLAPPSPPRPTLHSPPQSVRHSPTVSRCLSLSFTSNGVQ
jgi:hypothetical protein